MIQHSIKRIEGVIENTVYLVIFFFFNTLKSGCEQKNVGDYYKKTQAKVDLNVILQKKISVHCEQPTQCFNSFHHFIRSPFSYRLPLNLCSWNTLTDSFKSIHLIKISDDNCEQLQFVWLMEICFLCSLISFQFPRRKNISRYLSRVTEVPQVAHTSGHFKVGWKCKEIYALIDLEIQMKFRIIGSAIL